jgi:RNA polymerase sigma-70 factor (ECF subfamily)
MARAGWSVMSSKVVPFVKRGEPLQERSDDELMRLAATGVPAAFEALVRRHAPRVVAFVARQLGDRSAGEELAQEVWLSVWTSRDRYEPEGRFAVWLLTLARNRVRNAQRDGARRPARAAPGDAETATAATELSSSELDRLLRAERSTRVSRALEKVPPELREALLLRFAEELPYDVIAAIAGTNESTARSRVFHGLRRLRRSLKGEP